MRLDQTAPLVQRPFPIPWPRLSAAQVSDIAWLFAFTFCMLGVTMRTVPLLGLALIAAFVACKQSPSLTAPKAVIASLTETTFAPLTQDLEKQAATFRADCKALQTAPSADGLKATRKSYLSLRRLWRQADVMSFGPHRLYPYRIESRVDFYPPREEDIIAMLEGDADLTDDADTQLAATTRGLPTAGYLLWASDALASLQDNPRYGEYLVAVALLLEQDMKALQEAWSGDFADELLEPEDHRRYEDEHEVLTELVNNMAFTIELVRDRDFASIDPFQQVGVLETLNAAQAARDAEASLRGITMAFRGCYENTCDDGMRTLLKERRSELVDRMQSHLGIADQALDTLAQSSVAEPGDFQDQLDSADLALRDLVIFLQTDFMQALSVSPTFGGNDGD